MQEGWTRVGRNELWTQAFDAGTYVRDGDGRLLLFRFLRPLPGFVLDKDSAAEVGARVRSVNMPFVVLSSAAVVALFSLETPWLLWGAAAALLMLTLGQRMVADRVANRALEGLQLTQESVPRLFLTRYWALRGPAFAFSIGFLPGGIWAWDERRIGDAPIFALGVLYAAFGAEQLFGCWHAVKYARGLNGAVVQSVFWLACAVVGAAAGWLYFIA